MCAKIPTPTSVHFANGVRSWRVVRLSWLSLLFIQQQRPKMWANNSSGVSTCLLYTSPFSQHHKNEFNLLAPELFFFLILAHPVYKMWIIQEPNTLEIWNKLHFEEEKTESIYHLYKMWIIQEPNMLELWNKLHFKKEKTEIIYNF
jgi:hypothetical protein